MDGDGPRNMTRTQPASSTTPFAAWPPGPWDMAAVPPPHVAAPWPPAPALVNVFEDLYPDSSAPSALEDPFAGEVTPDMVLPALSAFPTYQQYTIQDSLLPADSYAALPPEYPLYNWTLPYGPERDLRSMAVAAPLHRPRPPRHAQAQAAPPGQAGVGVRTQFKGPREIRVPTAQAELQRPNLLPVDLDDAVVEVEVRTCRQDEPSASERVTFDSIEDALASIEAQDQLAPPLQAALMCGAGDAAAVVAARDPLCGRKQPLADEKQDEVVKAAKSLFSKRTRTLYHWLYPDTSKTKLKATVSAAWDTLADGEKQFYLSQVLGRFGLQASSVMINPQLDGIKGLPVPGLVPSWVGTAVAAATPSSAPVRPPSCHAQTPGRETVNLGGGLHAGGRSRAGAPARASSPKMSEAQEAVNQLFASCADSDTWASYSCSTADTAPAPRPAASRTRTLCGHSDRRKRASTSASGVVTSDLGPRVRLSATDVGPVDDEVTILKEMRIARLEAELEEDAELNRELEKFRLLASGERPQGFRDGEDYWRGTPDPEDMFTQLDF